MPRLAKQDAVLLAEVNRQLAADVERLQEHLRLELPEAEFKAAADAADAVDPEKRAVKERVGVLEDQEKVLAERYRGLSQTVVELRREMYKLTQRLKYRSAAEANQRKLTASSARARDTAMALDITLSEQASSDEVIDVLLRELQLARRRNSELQQQCHEAVAGGQVEDELQEDEAENRSRRSSTASSTEREPNSPALPSREVGEGEVSALGDDGAADGGTSAAALNQAPSGAGVGGGAGGAGGAGVGGERSGAGEEERLEELKGTLAKLGGKNNSKWQRRHFTLSYVEESNIYALVYRAKDKAAVKGSIALPWCSVRTGQEALADVSMKSLKVDKVDPELVFMLCPRMVDKKRKNYVMAAASKAEMNKWIGLIETAACFLPSAEDILRAGSYKLLDQ